MDHAPTIKLHYLGGSQSSQWIPVIIKIKINLDALIQTLTGTTAS